MYDIWIPLLLVRLPIFLWNQNSWSIEVWQSFGCHYVNIPVIPIICNDPLLQKSNSQFFKDPCVVYCIYLFQWIVGCSPFGNL